jgi:hypothetical protein
MSALLAAEVEGQRLREEELLGFCFLLVLAGNDTTASLIGTGSVLLATDPEQRAALVRDPSSWANAVEEINRLESPTQVLPRTTTCDVELHGTVIPSGSRVMLVWGSANHDERHFPDPERFDIGREITKHLAFGHGAHYCLGANLARLEARVREELRAPSRLRSRIPRRIPSLTRAWRCPSATAIRHADSSSPCGFLELPVTDGPRPGVAAPAVGGGPARSRRGTRRTRTTRSWRAQDGDAMCRRRASRARRRKLCRRGFKQPLHRRRRCPPS